VPLSPETAAFRPRIILVEDDAALLRALSFSLRIEGYEVDALGSAEALLAARFTPRLIIVVEQDLPGLTGLEALSRLRLAGVEASAVLLATDLAPRLAAEARRLGIVVVDKPILGDRLLAAVRRLWIP
jgi:two-component system, LuxR family, response regulator FixJ